MPDLMIEKGLAHRQKKCYHDSREPEFKVRKDEGKYDDGRKSDAQAKR